eukprot:6520414-Pyramimonas_sp.AAC.1
MVTSTRQNGWVYPSRGNLQILSLSRPSVPIEGDFGMAGAPADSESTSPATDKEIHAMLYPRVIGNPTNMEVIDDYPRRENPRDASDLSERIQ